MNNNTKVRLHLSKQLFESLTREIIKEAKANDGYTVAVKQPKMPKQSKSQATSPEVQKTDAEAMMGENKPKMPGKKNEMEMNVAEEGQLNEIDPATSWEAIAAGMAAIGLAPLAINKLHKWWEKKHPESFKKAQALSGAIDRQMGGNTPGQGHGVDTSKTFGPQNEISSEGIAALIGLIPGVALTAALIKDIVSYMKQNNLKGIDGFKQAYKTVGGDAAAHMDRKVGGNTPGQGHGVDTSKTFGPQNEDDTLKEYEHHYEVRNGECRRYNDEGEYTVVSMHHCR